MVPLGMAHLILAFIREYCNLVSSSLFQFLFMLTVATA